MIFWPKLGDVAFFKLPQEDDAVERMRLAKMLRLPGEEGVGIAWRWGGLSSDCHHVLPVGKFGGSTWIFNLGQTPPI